MTGVPYVTCSPLEPRKEEDQPKEKIREPNVGM